MASMRDIKRRKKQYYKYSADHKGHEARFYRQAAKGESTCGGNRSVFQLYVQDSKLDACKERQSGAPILKGR